MNKVMREVVEGERTGEPCLISLAITEPEAPAPTSRRWSWSRRPR